MVRRTCIIATIAFALAAAPASAKIDTRCPSTTATSAIAGVVKNAAGAPQGGVTVEVYQTNRNVSTGDRTVTATDGTYLICAGAPNGARHDAFDVHALDLRTPSLYARAAQPYTTYLNNSNADFTTESGTPLLYTTNLIVTPSAFNASAAAVDVTFLVRSKAPAGTSFQLTLDHIPNTIIPMTAIPAEGGGPASGGWNRWQITRAVPRSSQDVRYYASVRGLQGFTEITQYDRQAYVNDVKAPLFGPAVATACGEGVTANAFSPSDTTNRRPIVVHDACDTDSFGVSSGLDPYSLSGEMCRDVAMTLACTPISPVLNVRTIVWFPATDLSLGDHFLRWTLADMAGNTRTSSPNRLRIVARGGQTPLFSGVFPGNFGSGAAGGIIVGSTLTSPNSYPYIGFKITDADGQDDLSPGGLSVQVYYQTDSTLVYEYDITKAPTYYDAVSKRGGADFNLATGAFRADGFPLQGKPPGRYIATASITDRSGNSASVTWHWVLAAAV